MKVAVLKERHAQETRVAATPETVKKMVGLGLTVVVEKGAGAHASYPDEAYKAAGATIVASASAAAKDADVVLKVRSPFGEKSNAKKGEDDEAVAFKKGAVLMGLLSPYQAADALKAMAKAHLTTFSLELVPRISRAQSMDVLSSQSNLGGYRAVIEALYEYGRSFPMMMTAAGTVPPAKVLILGAGVAGLQAIATAKRMGAVVSAFDVRAAAKEQVESLGAKFIAVESEEAGEAAGGYAKEMSEDYKRRQAEKIHESVKLADIVITTALIPGKQAPVLVTKKMIADMKPGSVVVDMAVEMGGNCEGSKAGSCVEVGGVKLIGYANLPGRLAAEASNLYARNVLNLLTLLYAKDTKQLNVNFEDEIVKGSVLTHGGKIVHPNFAA